MPAVSRLRLIRSCARESAVGPPIIYAFFAYFCHFFAQMLFKDIPSLKIPSGAKLIGYIHNFRHKLTPFSQIVPQ